MRFGFGGYLEAEDIDDAISVLAAHLQKLKEELDDEDSAPVIIDDGVTDFEIVPEPETGDEDTWMREHGQPGCYTASDQEDDIASKV